MDMERKAIKLSDEDMAQVSGGAHNPVPTVAPQEKLPQEDLNSYDNANPYTGPTSCPDRATLGGPCDKIGSWPNDCPKCSWNYLVTPSGDA